MTAAPPKQPAVLRDGARLAYRLTEGEGPARFALIHSLAMDADFWEQATEHLGGVGSVLAYDCRGHGDSTRRTGAYTAGQFAADLSDLMDVVGWSDAIVAGASMGGCVSLAFAATYPERLRGLGLFDTTAWYGEQAPAQWEERAQKAVDGGMAALVDFQKSRWFSEGFRETRTDVVDKAVGVFLANDVPSYVETCRMLGRFDARAALPGIEVPTRIVVGSGDYATPLAMADAMRAAIPGATLSVLDGAAHFTPLERPDAIAAALTELAEASR